MKRLSNLHVPVALLLLLFSMSAMAVAPVPSFEIFPSDDGTQQVFSAAATRDPDGGNFVTFTYFWQFSPDPGGNNSRISPFVTSRALPPGTYTATLTVTDDEDETASTSRTFTVGGEPPSNNPPVAVNDFASAGSGETIFIGVLSNDSDPDGETPTIASATQPSNGSTAISGSSVRYQPNSGFSGTDTFSYTIRDAAGATSSAQVAVTVNAAPNQSPVAANDFAQTDADTGVNINVLSNDSDPDQDRLSISRVDSPQNGTASVNGGSIFYQPRNGFSGNDSFRYTISDAGGLTSSALISVTVRPRPPENDAPLARNDSAQTDAGSTVDIFVLSNDGDPDGDTISIVSRTQAENGFAQISGNSIRYTPNNGFFGVDRFTYTIRDPEGLTATATVTISVIEDQNLTPTADFGFTVSQFTTAFDWQGQPGDGRTDFSWEFGDGEVSAEENPSHTYGAPGSYPVKLTVADADGDLDLVTQVVVIAEPGELISDFSAVATVGEPLRRDFTLFGVDTSAGDLVFAWDFGDSTGISTEQNPQHQYASAGTYTVVITVVNNAGRTTVIEKDIIVGDTDVAPDDEVAAIIDTADFRILEGQTATLSGRGFRRGIPSGAIHWQQIRLEGEPLVTLSNNSDNTITFVAPGIDTLAGEDSEIELIFEMVASFVADPTDPDSALLTDEARITVIIEDNGITEIPAEYTTTLSSEDQTPFGVKTNQGALYLLKPFSLQQADAINATNRPRRAPLGLVELELHPDENGRAVIEFRLFDPLPDDFIWFTHSDENGWEVFPDPDSADSIVINQDTIILTLNDQLSPETRLLADQSTKNGIIRLRTGPGELSFLTESTATVSSGSFSLITLIMFGLVRIFRFNFPRMFKFRQRQAPFPWNF